MAVGDEAACEFCFSATSLVAVERLVHHFSMTDQRLTRAVCAFVIAAMLTITNADERQFDYHSVRGRRPTGTLEGRLEGELHFTLEGKSRVQGLAHYGAHWSGDAHLLWDGAVGDSMRSSFLVRRASRYRVTFQLTSAPDYGRFRIRINGKEVARDVDLYASKVALGPQIELDAIELKSGPNELVFDLIGANDQAVRFRNAGYLLGLDYVQLKDLDPPTSPPSTGDQRSVAAVIAATPHETLGLIRTYCVECHRGSEPAGDVRLGGIASLASAKTKLLVRVADVLARRQMPPEDEPQPKQAQRDAVAARLHETVAMRLRASNPLEPVVMRRLNRLEYNNAVRDLLKLKGDIYPLPEKVIRPYHNYFNPASGRFPDVVKVGNRALGKNQVERTILTGVAPFAIDLQAEHGFNNRGSELSVSPILLESFLKLGRAIVDSPEFDDYCELPEQLFEQPTAASYGQRISIAQNRIEGLLRRAFRKPISIATTVRYTTFFERELKRTDSWREAMKSVFAAVLASPQFLYLSESAGDGGRLNDYELAARLAMFLWSSIPDEELLRLAGRGELGEPEVVEQQVRRMLLDPRSRALSENFARQWLRLDQLITAVPDFDRFPVYYSRIGCEQWKFGLQMMVEPLLLFESIMVEDRSVMLLIDSNYSYRSDELQAWYGDNKSLAARANRNRFNTGFQSFRRRPLSTRREGGVITSAAVLTMTSSPLRTSPITRGSWVATVVLNQPPPPPPDVVPPIEADDADIEARGLTLRQRLQQHQVNDSCKSCHAKIDPLGFALENFDSIGRWRDRYRGGLPIDAKGKLMGRHEFQDVVGMKDGLIENPEWFLRAFSQHMLSYALGRELNLGDRPAVDRITRQSLKDHGRFTSIVVSVATSYPFLHKANKLDENLERGSKP